MCRGERCGRRWRDLTEREFSVRGGKEKYSLAAAGRRPSSATTTVTRSADGPMRDRGWGVCAGPFAVPPAHRLLLDVSVRGRTDDLACLSRSCGVDGVARKRCGCGHSGAPPARARQLVRGDTARSLFSASALAP